MRCTTCGSQTDQYERFCRKCGADLGGSQNRTLEPAGRGVLRREEPAVLSPRIEKDADELVGSGLASFYRRRVFYGWNPSQRGGEFGQQSFVAAVADSGILLFW